MVKCSCDAWGKCVIDASTTNTELANINPFRYRSYYFDTETGLYFLKTRYYDPEIARFITIDDISYLDPDSVNGLNLYAYCGNNPTNNADSTGTFAISTFLIGLAVSFAVAWALGEIFGHQLIGGIGSISGGVTAISTGISMFAFGPVGWVIGGIAIIAGAASIAFGTAEIQEHFTENNWIQDSLGWSDGLYNGLYFASNIVASAASVGGQVYKSLTTTKLFRAVNSAEANSIAKTRMFSEGAGQMGGKFFATQKSHALQWGKKLGAKRIVSIRVPKSALSHPSISHFNYRLDGIGPAYYFSDLDFLNSIFRHIRLH